MCSMANPTLVESKEVRKIQVMILRGKFRGIPSEWNEMKGEKEAEEAE